jgi:hypothetical protein
VVGKYQERGNMGDRGVNGSAIGATDINIRVMAYEVSQWIRLAQGKIS